MPSYKYENLFSDHRSEGHHGHLQSYMDELLPTEDSFLMTHALVTCCKGSFAEIIQTFFESIMQKCDCVQALMM